VLGIGGRLEGGAQTGGWLDTLFTSTVEGLDADSELELLVPVETALARLLGAEPVDFICGTVERAVPKLGGLAELLVLEEILVLFLLAGGATTVTAPEEDRQLSL
jgi:hypothetical protein